MSTNNIDKCMIEHFDSHQPETGEHLTDADIDTLIKAKVRVKRRRSTFIRLAAAAVAIAVPSTTIYMMNQPEPDRVPTHMASEETAQPAPSVNSASGESPYAVLGRHEIIDNVAYRPIVEPLMRKCAEGLGSPLLDTHLHDSQFPTKGTHPEQVTGSIDRTINIAWRPKKAYEVCRRRVMNKAFSELPDSADSYYEKLRRLGELQNLVLETARADPRVQARVVELEPCVEGRMSEQPPVSAAEGRSLENEKMRRREVAFFRCAAGSNYYTTLQAVALEEDRKVAAANKEYLASLDELDAKVANQIRNLSP